jgi:redox-regulated HSP33 family molecular chaperone
MSATRLWTRVADKRSLVRVSRDPLCGSRVANGSLSRVTIGDGSLSLVTIGDGPIRPPRRR